MATNIIEEIKALKETKDSIRKSLIKKGCDINEATPFREYASYIDNINIEVNSNNDEYMFIDMKYNLFFNCKELLYNCRLIYKNCQPTIYNDSNWIFVNLYEDKLLIKVNENYGDERFSTIRIGTIEIEIYQEKNEKILKKIEGIYSIIDNTKNNDSNLYYSQYIELNYKLLKGDIIEIEYASLTNCEGIVCGTENYNIKTAQDSYLNFVKETLVCDNDDFYTLYLFGMNNGNIIPYKSTPIVIKNVKISKNEKCVINLIPCKYNDVVFFMDTISGKLYMNKGIGKALKEFDKFSKIEKIENIEDWKNLFE